MEGETIIPNNLDRSFKNPGTLLDLDTGKKYKLKVGEQTVGRKDNDEHEKPDVAIETKDQYMSRIHLHINVEKQGEKFYHSFRVDSNTKNATYLNGGEVKRNKKDFLDINQVLSMPLAKIQIIDED